AAFDEDDHDDLGVLHRRERGEPGRVLAERGLRLPDELRGAGLASDVEPGNASRGPGAVVHRRPQAPAQELPHDRRELHVAVDLPGVAVQYAALGPLDSLHDPWAPEHAPVLHRGHEARDLRRRDEHGALADRQVDRLAQRPGAARWPRHQAELLTLELDPGRSAEAEGAGVARDGRATDLQARLVEEDVARLHDRALEVDRAVAALLPVFERRGAQMELAGALGPVGGRERALLERRGRDEDLEDGGRRVLALDRTVQ